MHISPPVLDLNAYKSEKIGLHSTTLQGSSFLDSFYDTWLRVCSGFTQWIFLTNVLWSSRSSWISLLELFSCLCKCSASTSPWPLTAVLLPPILSSSRILLTPVTRRVENNYKRSKIMNVEEHQYLDMKCIHSPVLHLSSGHTTHILNFLWIPGVNERY